jgi:hypothetical protein
VLHESSREHWGSISAKINKGPGYLKDYIGIDIHPHPWRGLNLHILDDPDYNVHTSLCSTVYLSNPRNFYLLLGIRLAVESITSDESDSPSCPADAIILLLWILTSQTCEREDWTHLIIRQLLDRMDLFHILEKRQENFCFWD